MDDDKTPKQSPAQSNQTPQQVLFSARYVVSEESCNPTLVLCVSSSAGSETTTSSVFELLASGIEIPDMSSSSGKENMSANTPTPKASAEPFTLNPPRQASQKLSSDLWDSSTYPLNFPILSSEIQSRKELKNAHLPTANLSNTTTTTTHGSSPSVDLPGTVTQEPDLSSASEDKLKDDEITGQDQDHSALDDKVQ